MYISKFEIKNIRGAGAAGLMLDLAKAVRSRPIGDRKSPLAGWNVIAGPNGYGKTTLLQGIAASLVGPAGGWLLIGLEDARWIAQGADSGTTTSWVERVPDDDNAPSGDETPKSVRLSVEWQRGGSVRMHFPRGGHTFVYSQFWQSNDAGATPDGWVCIGYGPHRAVQRSSNDANALQKMPPRASAVVSLFRDDAALERGYDWLKWLKLTRHPEEAARADVLNGVLRLLSDRLVQPASAMLVDEAGQLSVVSSSGAALAVNRLGEGYRMLISLVLDMLYQIDRFKPGYLLRQSQRWLQSPGEVPSVDLSGVVTIDEPENHLHPALQQKLGFWMKQHFPNIQFIVTTHSALICQAADAGGLFRMPRPFAVEVVDEESWEAVTNGTLDDAIMTELFGLCSPVAPNGQELRRELGELESQMQRQRATQEMIARRTEILSMLPSTVDIEVATALRRLAEGK